jgi:hypothetical protein
MAAGRFWHPGAGAGAVVGAPNERRRGG